MDAILQFGGLAVVALSTVGPVFGLMLLLNRRDHRRAALLGMVWERTPRDLAGLIAVQTRCALFSSRSVVTVEMRACSRDEVWEAIARWSPHLPPRARLLVKGTVDGGGTADVTLEASRRPSASASQRRLPIPG
jgi:hypothetical protein